MEYAGLRAMLSTVAFCTHGYEYSTEKKDEDLRTQPLLPNWVLSVESKMGIELVGGSAEKLNLGIKIHCA